MRFALALFLMVALLDSFGEAQAGHLFCHHCGRHTNCKKVCRLVCGKKKETKTEYSCEPEDFCVPGPSLKHGFTYECDEHGHKHRKPIWQPTCAKVHTRKKLVKKEVTKEVPDYQWVVEEYCCICGVMVKVERGAAPEKDGKASGGSKGAQPKSDSKSQTPLDQLPLASIDRVIPLSAPAPADDYSAYYEGVEPATLIDGGETSLRPVASAPTIASDFDELPESGTASDEPRRLFRRFFGK